MFLSGVLESLGPETPGQVGSVRGTATDASEVGGRSNGLEPYVTVARKGLIGTLLFQFLRFSPIIYVARCFLTNGHKRLLYTQRPL